MVIRVLPNIQHFCIKFLSTYGFYFMPKVYTHNGFINIPIFIKFVNIYAYLYEYYFCRCLTMLMTLIMKGLEKVEYGQSKINLFDLIIGPVRNIT